MPSYLDFLPPEVLQRLTTEVNSTWTDPNSGYNYGGFWSNDSSDMGPGGGPQFMAQNGIRGESPQTYGQGENALPMFTEVDTPMYDAATGQFTNMGTGHFGGRKADPMMNVGKALFAAIGAAGLGAAAGAFGGGAGAGAGMSAAEAVALSDAVYGGSTASAGGLGGGAMGTGAMGAGAGLSGSGLSAAELAALDSVYAGSTASAGGTLGATAGTGAAGATSGLLQGSSGGMSGLAGSNAAFNTALGSGASSLIPGIANSTLLQAGVGLLGAAAGGQSGQQNGQGRRELDPQVREAIFGQNGGLNFARGLFERPVAPNAFERFYGRG